MRFEQILNSDQDVLEIENNKVYLELESNVPDHGNYEDDRFMIYWGPVVDGDCLSDSQTFNEDWMENILEEAGVSDYELNTSENTHYISCEDLEDAINMVNRMERIIEDQGFEIIN